MRGLWTVTLRELNDWRPVAWVAGALLLLAWCLPWVPGFSHHDPADVRTAGASLLSGLLGLGLALFLGTSLLGREVSEDRLGFYLSMPLSAAQIWFGKVLAVTLVLFGSCFLVQIPILLGARTWLDPISDYGPSIASNPWQFGTAVLLTLLLVTLLSHGFGIGLRSRSPWLAIDALGLVVTGFLLTHAALGFLRYFAGNELVTGLTLWMVFVVTSWLVAGWLFLSQGGRHIQRGHRWQAVAAWSGTVTASLLLVAASHWVQGGNLDEAEGPFRVVSAPQGPWIAVGGTTPRRSLGLSTFLFNTETGSSARAEPLAFWTDTVHFTPSGTRAYSVETERNGPHRIVAWSLGEKAQRISMPLLEFDDIPSLAAEDGWLAIESNRKLDLYRVDPFELIGGTKLPMKVSPWNTSMQILPSGSIRVFSWKNGLDSGSVIQSLDFDGHRLVTRSTTERYGPIQSFWPESKGSALGFRQGNALSPKTFYHFDPDVDPEARRLHSVPRGFRTRQVVLDGTVLVARKEGDKTLMSREADQAAASVAGWPTSLRARPDQKDAILVTYEPSRARIFRVSFRNDGPIQTEEILSLVTARPLFPTDTQGLLTSRDKLFRFDDEDEVLEQILPR